MMFYADIVKKYVSPSSIYHYLRQQLSIQHFLAAKANFAIRRFVPNSIPAKWLSGLSEAASHLQPRQPLPNPEVPMD
jgi:hypothetical protein